MKQLNQMNVTKKNNKFYRIRNIETGLYLMDYRYKGSNKQADGTWKREYEWIFGDVGRLYKSERAARTMISNATGESYTDFSRLTNAGKVLKGSTEHSKFEIVKCSVSIRDVKA